MADNVELDSMSGGAVVATDDDGVAQHQYVKLEYGADGTFTKVSTSNPLPATDAGTGGTADAAATAGSTGSVSSKLRLVTSQLDSIKTAVETIDNTVSGSELQVDVVTMPTTTVQATNLDVRDLTSVSDSVSAVQSGTWNVTNVSGTVSLPTGASTSANQSTIIGHLDGVEGLLTTIDADTGNIDTSLNAIEAGYAAEGAALGSGVLIQGDDGTDRTNVLVDTDGHLQVDVLSGGTSGTQYTEGDTDATLTGTIAMAEGPSDTATPLQVDASKHLQVDIAADSVGIGGGTQYTEGDTDATITGNVMMMEGAANAIVAAQGTAADGLLVNLGSNNDVTVTGTVTANLSATDNAVLDNIDTSTAATSSGVGATADAAATAGSTGSLSAKLRLATSQLDSIKTAVETLDNTVSGSELQVDVVTHPGVVGTVADDSTTPGAPVMIGGSAKETDGTDPGSVSAEDDVARVITDRNRRLLVNTAHPNLWRASSDYASAQTNASIKTAPGASLSLYVTDIIVSNGATAGNITLLDGSGGTVLIELYAAINGGAVVNLRTPIRLTANTALCITSTTVTTHSVTVTGYTAP